MAIWTRLSLNESDKPFRELKGEPSLLELSDEELAKALRVVESQNGRLVPNVAGLLLLGKEDRLRQLIPTHQVFFQALDAQGNVKVNDMFCGPMVRVFNELESRFSARNEAREFLVGFVRVPVPDYSRKDIGKQSIMLFCTVTMPSWTSFTFSGSRITYSSPILEVSRLVLPWKISWFTSQNLETPVWPKPFGRSALLSRPGEESTDIRGQVQLRRPLPDYTRSDTTGVRVVLRGGKPSLEFAAFVYEQEESGNPLTSTNDRS